MRIKSNKGQKDIDDAKKAVEKLNNSVSKRIEEIAIHEMPDRYVSAGLRNWALLNRDVATLQKHLKGKLKNFLTTSLLQIQIKTKVLKGLGAQQPRLR